MTVLLVILDPSTYLLHHSELDPPDLARRIEAGDWSFAAWGDLWLPEAPQSLAVFEGMVVAAARLPGQNQIESLERAPRVQFSPQQVRILEGLMEGLTAKELALRLHLSERILDDYTGAMKRKLESKTIAQTVGRAVALGYWRPHPKNL